MKKGFFKAENVGGEYALFAEEVRRGTPTAVFGVSDSLKYLLASLIDRPVLYIASDAVAAKKAAENVASLSGKRTSVIAAKDEVLLYRRALSKDSLFRRLEGIRALKTGTPFVAAEIDALIQLFPKELPSVRFVEGDDFPFAELSARLTEMGYTRGFEVEAKGAFAIRGDILDIFPVNAENPVRVDFFGDTVEKIKPYDFHTGDRLENITEIEVISATDAIFTAEDIAGWAGTISYEVLLAATGRVTREWLHDDDEA